MFENETAQGCLETPSCFQQPAAAYMQINVSAACQGAAESERRSKTDF